MSWQIHRTIIIVSYTGSTVLRYTPCEDAWDGLGEESCEECGRLDDGDDVAEAECGLVKFGTDGFFCILAAAIADDPA